MKEFSLIELLIVVAIILIIAAIAIPNLMNSCHDARWIEGTRGATLLCFKNGKVIAYVIPTDRGTWQAVSSRDGLVGEYQTEQQAEAALP